MTGINKKIDRQVLLFVEQAQQQPTETTIRLPVDVAEVVAGGVLPIVGKLQPAPTFGRESFRSCLPCKRLFGDDVQVFELLEEVAVEPYGHGEKLFLCVGRDAGQQLVHHHVGIHLLGFAFEVHEHAVPKRRQRHCADVLR